jgi:DNA-binding response OmpR family regulator
MLIDIQRDIARDEELADLRAENRRLRGLLAGDEHRNTVDQLRGKLKTTNAVAWLLGMLYALHGETLTRDRIVAGMPGLTPDLEGRSTSVVQVQMCRVRKLLPEPGMVLTIRDVGYRLTAPGIKWVAAQLSVDE